MRGLAALTVLLFGCLVGVASAREVHVENGAMVYNAAPEGAFLTIKDYNGRPYLQDASTTVGPGCHNEAIPNQNDPDGPPEEVTFCDGVGSVDVRGTEGTTTSGSRPSCQGRRRSAPATTTRCTSATTRIPARRSSSIRR